MARPVAQSLNVAARPPVAPPAGERMLLWAVWLCMFLVLLTPLVVSVETLFPFVVGKALYARSLIALAFALWLLLALMSPVYRPPRSLLLVLLALGLGVALLAACFGVSAQRSLWSNYERMQGVVEMAHWFAFALVLCSLLRTSWHWRMALNLNLGVSLAVALLVLAQQFLLRDVSVIRWGDWTIAALSAYHGTASATLGNPIYLSSYLTLNAVIAVGFFAWSFVPASGRVVSGDARGAGRAGFAAVGRDAAARPTALWLLRAFWAGAAFVNLWVFIMIGQRGPLLGLLAALGFAALVYVVLERGWVRLVAIGLLCLMGLAAVPVAVLYLKPPAQEQQTMFTNRFLQRLTGPERLNTYQARLHKWEVAWRGFLDRPLLGWGPENFVAIFGRHVAGRLAKTDVYDHAHSRTIEELATKGVLGLAMHLALWIAIFLVLWRAAKTVGVRERVPIVLLGAALAGELAQGLTSVADISSTMQRMLMLACVVRLEGLAWSASPLRESRGAAARGGRAGWRAVAALVVVALLVCCLKMNYHAYAAANQLWRAAATDSKQRPEKVVDHLEQAIAEFTPLANGARLALFHSAAEMWYTLDADGDPVALRLLALVDAEAVTAVRIEPQNWRLHAALADFYRQAAIRHLQYQEMAEHHVRKLEELAPNRWETDLLRSLVAA